MTKVEAVLVAMQKAMADGRSYLAVSNGGSWAIRQIA